MHRNAFVWSHLTRGAPQFRLSRIALDDTMVVAFACDCRLSSRPLSHRGAVAYAGARLRLPIAVPDIVARTIRRRALRCGAAVTPVSVSRGRHRRSPIALLAPLVPLSGFQSHQIPGPRPQSFARRPVPILILCLLQCRSIAMPASPACTIAWKVSAILWPAPQALIGASNVFELAVAAEISLFGFNSSAALATVLGVPIEVPLMLSVFWIVSRSKH